MSIWFETHQTAVHPWMCDRFGHMNVRFYAHIFDDAGFALWPRAGVSTAMFEAQGVHTVVANTTTDFRREVLAGATLIVTSRFTKLGTKSVTYEQELRSLEDDIVHAIQTVVEVFFDPKSRSSAAVPDRLRKRLGDLGVGAT